MEARWAPRDNPVFQLVPPTFAQQAADLYSYMGKPAVSSLTFWAVYQGLLAEFHALPDDPRLLEAFFAADEGADDEVDVLAGLRELRHGDNVVGEHGYIHYGGPENPTGADEEDTDLREYVDFSD
jgi:hypothetical protein